MQQEIAHLFYIMDSKKTRFDKRRIIIFTLFVIYIFCVFYITLLNREPTYRRRVLTPLWEYHKLLHEDSHYWFQQITCNIIMLVPFGVFTGYRFKKMTIIQGAVLLPGHGCFHTAQAQQIPQTQRDRQIDVALPDSGGGHRASSIVSESND